MNDNAHSRERLADPSRSRLCALLAIWCAGTGVCVALALHDPEQQLRHPSVTGSAAVTVGWMMLAWAAMLVSASHGVYPRGLRHHAVYPPGSQEVNWLARWLWTLGFASLLVHFAFAFGLAHNWSHAAAVDHVREVGGYGEGIVVNYLFAAVWLADLVWWWGKPGCRARRPRWVAVSVHGFLAFVVVNATIIFGLALLLLAASVGKMGKIGSLVRNAP